MKAIVNRIVPLAVVLFLASLRGAAQQVPAAPATSDPRVGLKAGLFDAGEAIKNLEKLASQPKPDGFFDPERPAGNAAPPERVGPNGTPVEEPVGPAGLSLVAFPVQREGDLKPTEEQLRKLGETTG